MANALLVHFWKIKNIAKCNIAGFLKNIPIIDSENIGKKKTYAPPPLWQFFRLKKGGDLEHHFELEPFRLKKGGDLARQRGSFFFLCNNIWSPTYLPRIQFVRFFFPSGFGKKTGWETMVRIWWKYGHFPIHSSRCLSKADLKSHSNIDISINHGN